MEERECLEGKRADLRRITIAICKYLRGYHLEERIDSIEYHGEEAEDSLDMRKEITS